jgi:uncharacterized protein (DUF2267 family)
MSATGLEVFDKTLQETHLWLKALESQIGGEDRHRTYLILRSALHALRDRLGPRAAAQLGAQLPILLRGVFYEGWRPTDTPVKDRHAEEFFAHVRAGLPPGMKLNVDEAVRAVFAVISQRVDPGEVAKMAKLMPAELRELWPHIAVE